MHTAQRDDYEAPSLVVLGELADVTQSGLLLLGDLVVLGTTIP